MLKKFKQLNNFTSYYSYYDCTPVSTKGQGCSPRPASSKVSCPAPPVNPSPPGPGISSLLSPIPSSPGSAVSGKLMGWDGGVGPRGCHLLLLTGVGGQTDTHPRSPTSPFTPAPTFLPSLVTLQAHWIFHTAKPLCILYPFIPFFSCQNLLHPSNLLSSWKPSKLSCQVQGAYWYWRES
jgi:hypothetical protein